MWLIRSLVVTLALAAGSVRADSSAVPDAQYADLLASAVVATQFHAQDELGQYTYGYENPTAKKVETKTADGVVEGYYSYASPDGTIITNQYRADPITGFQSSLAPSNGHPLPIAVPQPVPSVSLLPLAPAPHQPAVAVDSVANVAVAAGGAYGAVIEKPDPVVFPDETPQFKQYPAVPEETFVRQRPDAYVEETPVGVLEHHHDEHHHIVEHPPQPVVQHPAPAVHRAPHVVPEVHHPQAAAPVVPEVRHQQQIVHHHPEVRHHQEVVHHQPAPLVSHAAPVVRHPSPAVVHHVQPLLHHAAPVAPKEVLHHEVHHPGPVAAQEVVHHEVHHPSPVVHHEVHQTKHFRPSAVVQHEEPLHVAKTYSSHAYSHNKPYYYKKNYYHRSSSPVVKSLGSGYRKKYGGYSSYRKGYPRYSGYRRGYRGGFSRTYG